MRTEIEIQGTRYPMRFGFGAFRILGSLWDCKGVQGVVGKIQGLFPKEGSGDIEFEQAEMIAQLIWAGIENAGTDLETPEDNDILDEVLLANPDKLQVVMTAFAESFPKSGNLKPVKSTGKGKRKKT